ncbi:MAG: FAD-dependent oxidoreductase, partial [Planctomycetes bacterium]|nr:FAD-dependent oxidoreductase [Planctomycetota bacterium]
MKTDAAADHRPAGKRPRVVASNRSFPMERTVDVAVAGGSIRAVAAALEAAENGASVFLAAPRLFLGEETCGTLRLWKEKAEITPGPLVEKIFDESALTTPLKVKKVLAEALVSAGVDFVLGCLPCRIQLTEEGAVAGMILADRAGRQAVAAKAVIDATRHAALARSAGVELRTRGNDKLSARKVVLGGSEQSDVAPDHDFPSELQINGEHVQYHRYDLAFTRPEGSEDSWQEIDQLARDMTYRPGQLRSGESLLYVPPFRINGRVRGGGDYDFESDDLGPFRPPHPEGFYVLGPCADLPEPNAARLFEPTVAEILGRRVGRGSATHARASERGALHAGGPEKEESEVPGDLSESLNGFRPVGKPERAILSGAGSLPILDEAEVVVVGGGTAGAAAAIGALRAGSDVLVLEYQEEPGGLGTVGLIGRAYHGLDIGLAEEVPFPGPECNVEDKAEWLRREIRDGGGRLWTRVLAFGAWMDANRITGVAVATPRGCGVVMADCVIDATGNADIAAAAGAETMFGDASGDIAMQGAGLALRPPGRDYVNTDYLLVDESDVMDVTRAMIGRVTALEMDEDYDLIPMLQTRERRRLVGEHVMSYLDQIAGRTYPDSIVLSESDYDSHGYPSLDFFALLPHTAETRSANHPAPGGKAYTPYRCLLPRGLDN